MRKVRDHARYFAAILLFSILMSGCAGLNGNPTPTVAQLNNQRISIETPPANATISSPLLVRGNLALPPAGSAINYRVFDSRNMLVGSGVLAVQPEAPTRFSGQVTFATTQAGPGRLELFEFVSSDNLIRSGVVLPVTLTAAGLTNTLTALPGLTQPPVTIIPVITTPLPGLTQLPGMVTPQITAQVTSQPTQPGQAIFIETPAPGTQVGSPVVLTGRVSRMPAQGQLLYRVLDANGQQIGGGSFPISAGADGQLRFTTSLLFTEPGAGGPIRIDLADQPNVTGSPVAAASIALKVAGANTNTAQQIIFTSPAANTAVNSPVIISGRTTRPPFQNNLSYTIRDVSGRTLGSGLIGVDESPPSFNVALPFDTTTAGNAIVIELLDQDANTGDIAGRGSLNLFYATLPVQATAVPLPSPTLVSVPPAGQAIIIETPAANTSVGNPVVVTGRVTVAPNNGRLFYRILDANNSVLGENSFVIGTASQPLGFVVPLSFNLPQNPGSILIELTDRDANGVIRARTLLQVQVASSYPVP